MKEFSFKGKEFAVEASSNSVILSTDDFKATPNELRALSYRAKDNTLEDEAHGLNKSPATMRNQISTLITRNTRINGVRPTTTELTILAEGYELLNELTILGLEVYNSKKK